MTQGADLPFPARPVIIGGGYIGVETASMLANLGAAPTILEATGGLLPGYDPALATGLADLLGQRVRVHVDALVRAITHNAGDYEVRRQHHGAEHITHGDLVIMATGRHVVLPEDVEALGLASDRAPVSTHSCAHHAHTCGLPATSTAEPPSSTPRCARAWWWRTASSLAASRPTRWTSTQYRQPCSPSPRSRTCAHHAPIPLVIVPHSTELPQPSSAR